MEETAAVRVLEVDPRGDVILVLDGAELLVSSKVLSLVSPVFEKLLGPNFVEGKQVSPISPGRIFLPEDNAFAMTTLCQVIHHCLPETEDVVEIELLEQVALLTDKYDCLSAMKLWSRHHLTMDDGMRRDKLVRMLLPTYVFDDYVGFNTMTKVMVDCFSGEQYKELFKTWSETLSPYVQNLFPARFFATLVEHSRALKACIFAELEDIIRPLLLKGSYTQKKPCRAHSFEDDDDDDCECNTLVMSRGHRPNQAASHDKEKFSEHHSTTISLFLKELEARHLWPVTGACERDDVRTIIDHLNQCNFNEMQKRKYADCAACNLDIRSRISQITSRYDDISTGLCLDCVKYGRDAARKCRLTAQHQEHAGILSEEVLLGISEQKLYPKNLFAATTW
ncbi:hypothetical protein MMC13_002408 [Lambiella insularis]|nr:hypothetical protein [Lambiella insularis]